MSTASEPPAAHEDLDPLATEATADSEKEHDPGAQIDEERAAQDRQAEPPTPPDPEAEIAALKDRLLRHLAEAENLRRRAERDVREARKAGVATLARDLLSIRDDFERAIEALNRAGDQADLSVYKAFSQGVEITHKSLKSLFERHDIKAIEPLGESFDPHRHQAVFQVPSADHPSGAVVQVVQTGYAIGDQVLRAAMVGVATKAEAPKQAEEVTPPAETAQEDRAADRPET